MGSNVRIGIEAPPEIRIFRHELWLEIQAENKAAAEASVADLHTPEESVVQFLRKDSHPNVSSHSDKH